LIGEPQKGSAVVIGLEDGRSLLLNFGTTVNFRQWEIVKIDELDEVTRVYQRSDKDALRVAGDLYCCVSSDEIIAVGRTLRIQVISRVSDESKTDFTQLDSPVVAISIL
jgi:hypothetical protein